MLEPEFAYDMSSQSDEELGRSAGWRKDELVAAKSQEYMDGYDMGRMEREEYERWRASA